LVLASLRQYKGRSPEGYPGQITYSTLAKLATTARNALVLDDLAIKVVLGLDNAAKEHPAIVTGARPVLSPCHKGIARGKLGVLDATFGDGDAQGVKVHARATPVEVIRTGTTLPLAVLDIVGALPILTRNAVDRVREMAYLLSTFAVELEASLFPGGWLR
jgi:hypothetical protein